MSAGIDLVRGGALIVRVDWSGPAVGGVPRVRAVGRDNLGAAATVRAAIADRQDLARVRFLTAAGREVTGWRGFDGWVQALALTVAPLGLGLGAIERPE